MPVRGRTVTRNLNAGQTMDLKQGQTLVHALRIHYFVSREIMSCSLSSTSYVRLL